MKKIIIILSLIIIYSCDKVSNNPNKKDNTSRQTVKNESSNISADDLFQEGTAYLSNYEEKEAIQIFQNLKEKYPNYKHSKVVDEYIKSAKNILLKKEELLKKGFKGLSENNNIKYSDLTYTFSNISIQKRWIADNYDDRYFYWEAERGNKYIVAKFSIKSESKEPLLYPLFAYKLIDNKLEFLGSLNYKFNRWEDYGTYLGNYIDRGNSFLYSEKINFSCGYEIEESILKMNAVFIVLKKDHCIKKEESKFENPPIRYSPSNCEYKQILTTEDFLNNYVLIKIFGKEKL